MLHKLSVISKYKNKVTVEWLKDELCQNFTPEDKNDEIGAKYLSKNTSNTAPKPTRPGKVLPNKKGKINIQISNFESSGTNYSTLERKKF